jgi:hypothetical protein
MGHPKTGHLGPKHVVLIAKANVNEEVSGSIIDGKLYVNRVEFRKKSEICVSQCVSANSGTFFTTRVTLNFGHIM